MDNFVKSLKALGKFDSKMDMGAFGRGNRAGFDSVFGSGGGKGEIKLRIYGAKVGRGAVAWKLQFVWVK
jgi:hypothetical protein